MRRLKAQDDRHHRLLIFAWHVAQRRMCTAFRINSHFSIAQCPSVSRPLRRASTIAFNGRKEALGERAEASAKQIRRDMDERGAERTASASHLSIPLHTSLQIEEEALPEWRRE
jgi:hypothetical protein